MKKRNLFHLAAALTAAAVFSMAGVLTAMADQAATATITSAVIGGDRQTVTVTASTGGDLTGTDGSYYLFELEPYENDLSGRSDYLASGTGSSQSWQVSLNRGTADDRLYSRFVVAVKGANGFESVSQPHYITNPEVVAPNQAAFNDPLTKKGLNIELNMLSDAFDLGVKHVGTNIAFHQIIGQGIDYTYDGKTYHFSKDVIATYDKTISALSGKGMTVTAIILNGWNNATPDLIYPGVKQQNAATAAYYMFNAETEAGFEQTRAIAAFLAERYDGSNPNYGKISNWVIGNEINCQLWNYMGPTDVTTYVRAYEKAFRVFYTAIKSTSANDRVYFSLAFWWGAPFENRNDNLNYPGKSIVDTFNSIANVEGQMDWGLAYHPYPYPMTEPEFWDDASTGMATQDINTPILNFANLHVLTDYFNQDAFKQPDGHVRHIILTEQGFTSQSASRGEIDEIQAAAYAYSYYLVDSNPYIDAYILSRQVDAPVEVNAGQSFGLWSCDMTKPDQIVAQKRKKIWQVFRDIDKKKDTLEATEFAKAIIGIQKWSDVVPDFKWRSQENK